jgi:pimeloyl-ACP methyl ester carboxylesterase
MLLKMGNVSILEGTFADDATLREGFRGCDGARDALWPRVLHTFEKDAEDFASFSLVPTGERASGDFLIQQGRLVATNVEGVVVRNSGHWLMEEVPNQVIPKLVEFLNR